MTATWVACMAILVPLLVASLVLKWRDRRAISRWRQSREVIRVTEQEAAGQRERETGKGHHERR